MLLMLLNSGASGPIPELGRLVELSTARGHLRLDEDYPADQFEGKLNAAEESAMQFMNRRVFKTSAALSAAIATVPASLAAAGAAYAAAKTLADLVEDEVARSMALEYAVTAYRQAQLNARETYGGIVINDAIASAILLTLGHLFENRQDVQQGAVQLMPIGAEQMLFPFRVGLGV